MPKIPPRKLPVKLAPTKKVAKKPDCLACGDTGVNSRGGPCVPCQRRKGIG